MAAAVSIIAFGAYADVEQRSMSGTVTPNQVDGSSRYRWQ